MSATSQFEASLRSRRDPARLNPQRAARAAYGPFCDALRRLGCLTPTQREVASLLAEATLLTLGVTSLPFESLESLTALGSGRSPFAGLGKNDLSLAINGGMARGDRLQHGLKHFGIVVLDERGPLERGLKCTILTVIADPTQWAVPAAAWRYTPQEKGQWLKNVVACRAAFTGQLEGLVEDADLIDARAAIAVEAIATQASNENARDTLATNISAASRARVSAGDAREVVRERTRGLPPPCRSDSRNAKNPAKAGCVLTFGTATVKQLNSLKQRTVQPLNSTKVDDSNRLLELLRIEFERVHGSEAAAREMENSGACWRMIARRWPDEFEQQIAALRCFLNEGGKVKRAAWFYIQHYLTRAVGCDSWSAVCEKSKESFKTT